MNFSKVSFNRWAKDVPLKGVDGMTLQRWYHNIKLPQQGAAHSMGIDFFMPYNVSLLPHNEVKIPTGIRWICDCDDDFNYGLMIMPRSGLGCKYGLHLKNTVGVIDSTYCNSDNEGHILITLVNPSDEVVELPAGKAFVQGIITPYKTCKGTESEVVRNGGFNSTGGGYGAI